MNILNRLAENFKMAIDSIVSNKLRSFLTMLGIIIGISSMEFSRDNINVPIIIIDKNFIYKYIVEIIKDGTSKKSGSKKKEQNKLSRAVYKGYTLFKLDIHS